MSLLATQTTMFRAHREVDAPERQRRAVGLHEAVSLHAVEVEHEAQRGCSRDEPTVSRNLVPHEAGARAEPATDQRLPAQPLDHGGKNPLSEQAQCESAGNQVHFADAETEAQSASSTQLSAGVWQK